MSLLTHVYSRSPLISLFSDCRYQHVSSKHRWLPWVHVGKVRVPWNHRIAAYLRKELSHRPRSSPVTRRSWLKSTPRSSNRQDHCCAVSTNARSRIQEQARPIAELSIDVRVTAVTRKPRVA